MKNTPNKKAKSFSEIQIGDTAEFEVLVNEEMHNTFAKLSKDYSPVHTNDGFCSTTKFKKKIGYAFLLTSFLSRLYGEYLPGGSSICIKQESSFINPYFIGDKIKIVARVTKKIESTKFVEIETLMYRNESICIFKGMGIVQVVFDKNDSTTIQN